MHVAKHITGGRISHREMQFFRNLGMQSIMKLERLNVCGEDNNEGFFFLKKEDNYLTWSPFNNYLQSNHTEAARWRPRTDTEARESEGAKETRSKAMMIISNTSNNNINS